MLLKATAGGGGKGCAGSMRERTSRRSISEAALEAEKAFGNAGLYLEKYIVDGRHIEFQIMADAYGKRRAPGRARVLGAAPPPEAHRGVALPGHGRRDARRAGRRSAPRCARIGYRNAGTVEFFRDPDGQLYFMEMNTRLQVEHPVTEMVTGRDLVVEQIRVAANEPLSFAPGRVSSRGARDRVPDQRRGSVRRLPALARESSPSFRCRPAARGVEVRVDTHVRAGYRIPPHYDSLIAKLIVRGPTRDAARRG